LDDVPAFQQMRAIQMEFLREMLCRRTLSNTAHNQDNRFTGIATLAPDGVGEEIVDCSTPPTPIIENRRAMAIMRGLIFRQKMSLGTAQAFGM
jgi:hypothetical protein